MKGMPVVAVGAFGAMQHYGSVSLFDFHGEAGFVYSLKKGSLWTMEWTSSAETLSIGIKTTSKRGYLIEIICRRFWRSCDCGHPNNEISIDMDK